jgi:hypothetical protein
MNKQIFYYIVIFIFTVGVIFSVQQYFYFRSKPTTQSTIYVKVSSKTPASGEEVLNKSVYFFNSTLKATVVDTNKTSEGNTEYIFSGTGKIGNDGATFLNKKISINQVLNIHGAIDMEATVAEFSLVSPK